MCHWCPCETAALETSQWTVQHLVVSRYPWSPSRKCIRSANGFSLPLRRELPTTANHHLFLIVLVVIRGADCVALLSSSISPDVSSSVFRAVKLFCKDTSDFGEVSVSADPCFCKLPLFYIIWPPLFHVCWWGSFRLFGYGSTADSAWNQLFNSFSSSLMLCSLLNASCCTGPPPKHTLCRQVYCLSLPQEKGLDTSCRLKSTLQPLHSAAPSGWVHQPPQEVNLQEINLSSSHIWINLTHVSSGEVSPWLQCLRESYSHPWLKMDIP